MNSDAAMSPDELAWAFNSTPDTGAAVAVGGERAEARRLHASKRHENALRAAQERADRDLARREEQARLDRQRLERVRRIDETLLLEREAQAQSKLSLERMRYQAAARQLHGAAYAPSGLLNYEDPTGLNTDFFTARNGFMIGVAVGAGFMGLVWAVNHFFGERD